MKAIVRIVSEEAFKGLVTSYVGPFLDAEAAQVYVDDLEAFHDGEAEWYVEDLHDAPEGY